MGKKKIKKRFYSGKVKRLTKKIKNAKVANTVVSTAILVKDILRTKFTFFDIDDTLGNITETLVKRHISSAPVVKNGKYVGMISDSSIIKMFNSKEFEGIWTTGIPAPMEKIKNTPVKTLIEQSSVVVNPDQTLESILPLVLEKKLDCLPVMEKNGELVGIIRGVDVIRVLEKYFAAYEQKDLDEMPIEERICMETILDRILHMVEKDGNVSASNLASKLNIKAKEVEELGCYLEKHGLIKIRRTLWGQTFTRVEKG
jgi:predicted transcriptional regulator